jgi:glucose-6-phosphate 1-dehydrogenase
MDRRKKVKGYRKEPDVNIDSTVKTFAAVKLFVDNWIWQGVPFYLRTGKRMDETISVITVPFKPVPHQSFPAEVIGNWQPNRLDLHIQSHLGISTSIQAKRPGLKMLLYPVDRHFDYNESYTSGTPEAYETLLLDIMECDATHFMRADQVEAAWKALMPVINSWESIPAVNFPNYKAGAEGPKIQKHLLQNSDTVGFKA